MNHRSGHYTTETKGHSVWFVRFGIAAFVLSLTVWVVSETWAIGRAGSYSGYAFGWYLIDGELDICLHRHPGFCPYPADWFFMDSNGDFSFEMSYIDGEVAEMWGIYVPLWPVCGALGVLCVWMWRKQRRRRGTGAFPVQPMASKV